MGHPLTKITKRTPGPSTEPKLSVEWIYPSIFSPLKRDAADLFTASLKSIRDMPALLAHKSTPAAADNRLSHTFRPPGPPQRSDWCPYILSWQVLAITSSCCSLVRSMNFTAYPDTRIVKFAYSSFSGCSIASISFSVPNTFTFR